MSEMTRYCCPENILVETKQTLFISAPPSTVPNWGTAVNDPKDTAMEDAADDDTIVVNGGDDADVMDEEAAAADDDDAEETIDVKA